MDPETTEEAVAPAPETDVTATPEPVETITPIEQTPEVPATPKTFTQEELDRLLTRERAKARRHVEREFTSRVEQPRAANITNDQFAQLTPDQQIDFLANYKANEMVQQQEALRQRTTVDATYEDRAEAARDKYDDFNQVAHGDHWSPTPGMTEAIKTSDIGPDLAYYLGSNPKEASRIAALSPVQQIREIGKIEAKIENTSIVPVKRTSSAPAPITPVTPRASLPVVDTTDPRSTSEMSPDRWIEAENARVRARYKAQHG